jgi:sec-independent protein translocase protein TatA
MLAAALGAGEIAVIILVVILLFGATKLPQLARSLGSSAREFRKGVEEGTDEDSADDAPEGTGETPADESAEA